MLFEFDEKRWNTNKFDLWLSMIMYTTEFVIFILICCLYMYLFKNDKNSKIHTIISSSLILSILYCILSFIFIDGNYKYNTFQYLYNNLIFGIIILQRACIHLCNAYKLDISFDGSIFEIKKYIFITFYYILGFMCCSYFALVYILRHIKPIFRLILIIFVVMDILCAFISIKIFTIKINKLLKMRMVPEMKFIVHKLSVLTVIHILSSLIFILIPGITLNGYITPHKIFGIDLIINNIILIFSFGAASNLYRNICCCLNCQNIKLTAIRVTSIPAATNITPTIESQKDNPNASDKEKSKISADINTDISLTINNSKRGESGTELPPEPTKLIDGNVSNSLKLPQILNNKSSNTLRLYKNYSNSVNIPPLSCKDSLSRSQQTSKDTTNFGVLIPMQTESQLNTNNLESMKSIDTPVITPFDDKGNDINWNRLSIIIDYNDNNNNNNKRMDLIDDYEALKRATPITCVKQMKQIGIIM